MRSLILSMLLIVPCFGEEGGAVVRFSNGDQLVGRAVSLSTESLKWESLVLAEPANFDLKNVIDFMVLETGGKEVKVPSGHVAQLEMTNGDVFCGKLAGLGDEEIRLDTWYAGELVFRRVNVKEMKISAGREVIYSGPVSMEEWTQSGPPNSWSFKAGGLHAARPGGVARNVDFPDVCSISFIAAWKGNFRPKIRFFSDDIETIYPKHGFSLDFQTSSVHMKNLEKGTIPGKVRSLQHLRSIEKAKFEICANQLTGEVVLYVDDELYGSWESEDFSTKGFGKGFGKGFSIVSLDNTPIRFSEIKISEWDGVVDETEKQNIDLLNNIRRRNGIVENEGGAEEEALVEGRMLFHNGDSMKGEVTKIEGEDITVKTDFGEVTFPVELLKNLALKKSDIETPKREKGDVRATLLDDTKIVFRLDGVEGGKLVGFSQNFGTAEFLQDAFKRIEFNIYDKKMEKQRALEGW